MLINLCLTTLSFVETLEARVERLQESVAQLTTELDSLSPRRGLPSPSRGAIHDKSILRDLGSTIANSEDGSAAATRSSWQRTDLSSQDKMHIQMNENQQHEEHSAPKEVPMEECLLNVESVVSLSEVDSSGKAGLFDSMAIFHVILSMNGSDPYRPFILRSIFQSATSATHTSQNVRDSPILREMLFAEGNEYLDLFENVFHYRYPLLDVPKLRDIWRRCKADETLENRDDFPGVNQFCLYAVLAIGIAMNSHHISLARHIEGNLLLAALGHLESVFHRSGGLEQVRILLLLPIYSLYRSSTGTTWHLVGFAIRICISHSHHLTQMPPGPCGKIEALWSACMLEQEICDALDRPPSLSHVDLLAWADQYQAAPGQEQPQQQPSCRLHEYWVTRSRLLARLDANSPMSNYSVMQLMRALHSLRVHHARMARVQSNQEASPTVPHAPPFSGAASPYSTGMVDEIYIGDLLRLLSDKHVSFSEGLNQFCLSNDSDAA